MEQNASEGVQWAEYHAARVFNAVEFLRENGYFSFFGFSVHTSCTECLVENNWSSDKIYKSALAIAVYLPYILMNEVGGADFLYTIGPIWDFLLITAMGVLTANLIYNCLDASTDELYRIWISSACLAVFFSAPWTYKMFLALWHEVYFFLFALLALNFIQNRNLSWSLFFFFVGCLFHPLLGLTFSLAFSGTWLLAITFNERNKLDDIFCAEIHKSIGPVYFLVTAIGVCSIFFIAQYQLKSIQGIELGGSSILARMGLSGQDPFNGGILGALQFLGGQRITSCFEGTALNISDLSVLQKMQLFNCFTTNISMWIVSLMLIIGVFLQIKFASSLNLYSIPIGLSFLYSIAALQQSFSVHLLGHSYIFSFLAAIGIFGWSCFLKTRIKSYSFSIALFFPIIAAIIFLFIHVSMLETIRIGSGVVY